MLLLTLLSVVAQLPSWLMQIKSIQISTVAQKLHVCQIYFYCVVKQSQKQTRQPTYYSVTAENTQFQKQMTAAR